MLNEIEKWVEEIKELSPSSAAVIEDKMTLILLKLKTIERYTEIVLEQVPDIVQLVADRAGKQEVGETPELLSLCFNLATQEHWLRLYLASLTPIFYFILATTAAEVAIGLEQGDGFSSAEAPIVRLLLKMIASASERIVLTDADTEIINARTDQYIAFFLSSKKDKEKEIAG